MRDLFRDFMILMGVIFAGISAYYQSHPPAPTDPPAVQVVAQHPVGGLIVVAVLFLIAGALNSTPLLLRMLPAKHKDGIGEQSDNHEEVVDDAEVRDAFLGEHAAREKYQDQFVLCREERDQLRSELDKLKAQKPDTTVKDSDPQIEIKVADLRGVTGSTDPIRQACLDLINRGKQSPAMFVCIEDFKIGNYQVAFRGFPPPIPPYDNHDSAYPLYINNPDGTQCKLHIFTVFYTAWEELKNVKLYEYKVPIRATYQDDANNLFEVRCDLVFYPHEFMSRMRDYVYDHDGGGTVLEVKNRKIRKIASASRPIDWSV